jgi:hypothetical protein
MCYGEVLGVQGMLMYNSILIIDIIQISCLMKIFTQDHMEEIETLFPPKNSYQ